MPRSPRSTHRTPADGRNLERVIGIEAEPHSEGQNNAVVSASFTYLAVAGPIAPSISIISAGLPLSSADRSAGEANWTAAAIAATRVACTILTARLPIKTKYGGSLPLPQYDRPRRTADRRQTSPKAGAYRLRRKNFFNTPRA